MDFAFVFGVRDREGFLTLLLVLEDRGASRGASRLVSRMSKNELGHLTY